MVFLINRAVFKEGYVVKILIYPLVPASNALHSNAGWAQLLNLCITRMF